VKEAAGWQCEACCQKCRKSGESWANFFDRTSWGLAQDGKWQRYTLTVAHLDHRPENCDRANLRALCAPCHCRYDLKAMPTKKRLKAEREGQLNLLGGVDNA
jgi:hypothetical protein